MSDMYKELYEGMVEEYKDKHALADSFKVERDELLVLNARLTIARDTWRFTAKENLMCCHGCEKCFARYQSTLAQEEE